MAQTPKQDFYSSREPERSPADEPFDGPGPAGWTPPARGFPMGLLLIVLGFLGVLVGVILYQRNLLNLAREKERERASAPAPSRAIPRSRIVVEFDPLGRMVLDETGDIAPQAPPAGGVTNLTAHWIKQAAQHLRQAERAAADGDWRDALTNYQQVARIVPSMERLQENIGLCHLRMQAYEPAERVFGDLAAAWTNSAGLLNNLAVARMGLGRHDEAEKDLRRALELKADHAAARHNLGLLYFRTGQWEKAAGILAEVYKTAADNSELALMHALTLMRLNRWPQAEAVLEASSRASNAAAPLFFRLAEARSHLGDFPGAVRALQDGINLVDQRTALLWLNRSEMDLLRDRPEFKKIVLDLTRPR